MKNDKNEEFGRLKGVKHSLFKKMIGDTGRQA
jgi:hypothetical protein